MRRNVATLFLQYARLDRKRSVEGLSALEEANWANLDRYLSNALNPHVPPGAERRSSIRVPAEYGCRWQLVAREQEAQITTLSRTGAFVRTDAPAPIGERITLRIALPEGSVLEVLGTVANHILAPDPERRGMGVRFDAIAPEAMKVVDELYQRSIVREYGPPEEQQPA